MVKELTSTPCGITPRSSEVLAFSRGVRFEGVCLTNAEFDSLIRLYGFEQESDVLMRLGANRNMFRQASHDGLRLIAWLAKHVPKGTDPLKFLVLLAADAGLDVDCSDTEWASGECTDDEAEHIETFDSSK